MTTPDGSREEEIYAELGRLVVQWSSIEFLLKQLLASLSGAGMNAAYTLIGDMSAGRVIERAKRLAASRLDDPHQEALKSWLDAAQQALVARNRAFHGVWGWQLGTGRAVRATVSIRGGNVHFDQDVYELADVRAIRETVTALISRVGEIAAYL